MVGLLRIQLLLERDLEVRRVHAAILGRATDLDGRNECLEECIVTALLAEPELAVVLRHLEHVVIKRLDAIVESLDLLILLVTTQSKINGELGRARAGVLSLRRVLHTERGAETRCLENEVTGVTIAYKGHLSTGLVGLGRADDDLGDVERRRLNDGRRHDNDWTYG